MAPPSAAFLALAALVTSDRGPRADRALAAAAVKDDSGDLAARRMPARLGAEPDDVDRYVPARPGTWFATCDTLLP